MLCRINLQVAVEAEVADDSDPQAWIGAGDCSEPFRAYSGSGGLRAHFPKMRSTSAAASRKSGITTSAPTPSRRSRFQESNLPEPLLASSDATATASPPTSF